MIKSLSIGEQIQLKYMSSPQDIHEMMFIRGVFDDGDNVLQFKANSGPMVKTNWKAPRRYWNITEMTHQRYGYTYTLRKQIELSDKIKTQLYQHAIVAQVEVTKWK